MKEFKTSDFYTAATLKALGYPVLRIEGARGEKRRIVVFDDPKQDIKDVVLDYENGRVTCEIKTFIAAMDSIKNLIFN